MPGVLGALFRCSGRRYKGVPGLVAGWGDGMNKQVAEFIGTFALVFFGCGAAVVGGMGSGPTAVNLLGIASAFGFADRRHGLRHRADLRLPCQSGGELRRLCFAGRITSPT